MAIIKETQTVTAGGTTDYWIVKTELDTDTGNKKTTVIDQNGNLVVRQFGSVGTPEKVQTNLAAINQTSLDNATKELINQSISVVGAQSASLTAQYQNVNPTAEKEIPAGESTDGADAAPSGRENQANDDEAYDPDYAAMMKGQDSNDPENVTNENNEMETLNESYAGSTVAGQSNTASKAKSSNTSAGPKPGKRLKNPLASFSSFTYQITLYMITPDAYDAFIASGRRKIDALSTESDGAFIVAQSGGINNETSRRPPGFKYDYYIDDLKIKNSINGKETLTASNVTEMSFNIYEPYGFSFINNLAKAALALKSKTKNFRDLSNASRQFFVLGLRFQGYDMNGKLMTASDISQENTVSNVQGESGGIFERFFDIYLTAMNFKIDGKMTVYSIKAATCAPKVGFGAKRGVIDTGARLVAGTVAEAIGGLPEGDPEGVVSLLGTLNEQQQLYVKNAPPGSGAIANVYKLEFLGNSDLIKNASMVTEVDKQNKDLWPMSKASKTILSNDKLSVSATPDNTRRTITFRTGISIMQSISSIISQSTYLSDALKVIYTDELEPDTSSEGDDEEKHKNPREIQWYNLGSRVKVLGFDKNQGDWAYEITYVIQPYSTPLVISPYAGKLPKYYGPHKRYDYWYTGKNSEIIFYEQKLDNAYFNTAIMPTGDPASQGGSTDTPTIQGKRQNEDRTGRLDIGKEAQNSYLTSLFDPGSYAKAKITIMGDPDYLIQDSPSSVNTVYSQFYGSDGFTINPNGGQVFIEIDFKEADDYKASDGTLSINESILFWKYPKSVSNLVKGVSYMVNTVTSQFSKGKFTQDLDAVINTFPGAENLAADAGREAQGSADNARLESEGVRTGSTQGDATGSGSEAGTSATSNTGYLPDEYAGYDQAVSDATALGYDSSYEVGASIAELGTNNQQTTPTGQGPGLNEETAGASASGNPVSNLEVADDDASGDPIAQLIALRKAQDVDAGRETDNTDQNNRARAGVPGP